MPYPTGNPVFDQAAAVAESVRQAAVAAATTQADANVADNAYFNTIVAAGTANGIMTSNAVDAINAGGN